MSTPIGSSSPINPTDPSTPFDTPSTFFVNSGDPDVLELSNSQGQPITRSSTDPSGANAIFDFLQQISSSTIDAKDILYTIAQQQADSSVQLQQMLLDIIAQQANAADQLASYIAGYTALTNTQNGQINTLNTKLSQLNSSTSADANAVATMQTAIAQSNAVPPQISTADFNQAVNNYNAYIATRNAAITTANNTTIQTYNNAVTANNATIRALNQSVSGDSITNIPTQAVYPLIPLLPTYTNLSGYSPSNLSLVSTYPTLTQSTIDSIYAAFTANFANTIAVRIKSVQSNIQGISQNLNNQVNLLIRRSIITPDAFIDLSKKLSMSLGTGSGVGLNALAAGPGSSHLAGQISNGIYQAIMENVVLPNPTDINSQIDQAVSALFTGSTTSSLSSALNSLYQLQEGNPAADTGDSLQIAYALFLSNALSGDATTGALTNVQDSTDSNTAALIQGLLNSFSASASLSQGLGVLGSSPLAPLLGISLVNSLATPTEESENETGTVVNTDSQKLQQIVQKQQNQIISNLQQSYQDSLALQAKLAADDAVKFANAAEAQNIDLNIKHIANHLTSYGFVGPQTTAIASQFIQNINSPNNESAASELNTALVTAFKNPDTTNVIPAVQASLGARLHAEIGSPGDALANEFVHKLFDPANPKSSINQVRDAITTTIKSGNDKLAQQQVSNFADFMQPMTSLYQSSQNFLTPTGLITHGEDTSIWNKRLSQANAAQDKSHRGYLDISA